MRLRKLPFRIRMERKYSGISISKFVYDWENISKNKRNRVIIMDNELHAELKKFESLNVDMNEIIDIGMRYALAKEGFIKMIEQLITYKENPPIV